VQERGGRRVRKEAAAEWGDKGGGGGAVARVGRVGRGRGLLDGPGEVRVAGPDREGPRVCRGSRGIVINAGRSGVTAVTIVVGAWFGISSPGSNI